MGDGERWGWGDTAELPQVPLCVEQIGKILFHSTTFVLSRLRRESNSRESCSHQYEQSPQYEASSCTINKFFLQMLSSHLETREKSERSESLL